MQRSCKIAVGAFLALGIAAIALVPLSAAGVFGLQPDPLSGVFAVLLATPWFWVIDALLGGQARGLGLFMAAVGIGLNAGIIGLACARMGGGQG